MSGLRERFLACTVQIRLRKTRRDPRIEIAPQREAAVHFWKHLFPSTGTLLNYVCRTWGALEQVLTLRSTYGLFRMQFAVFTTEGHS